jgi:hypothetical protein
LKKLSYISFFVPGFLTGFISVFLALNSFDDTVVSDLRHAQGFGDEESEKCVAVINHQTGFDEEHTVQFRNANRKIIFKRLKGKRDENSFVHCSVYDNIKSFLYSQKVSFLNAEVFMISFFSSCFQQRGPPVLIN